MRYEKIGRWEDRFWVWEENPNYDRLAVRIADGHRDKRKQDSLYVRIGADGRAASTPQAVTEQETTDELDRASRYSSFVGTPLRGEDKSERFKKTIAWLKVLFASPSTEASSGRG